MRRGETEGVAIIGMSTAGCAKIGSVMAMFKFKQANQAYQSQDYERSSKLYEETIANDPNNAIVKSGIPGIGAAENGLPPSPLWHR